MISEPKASYDASGFWKCPSPQTRLVGILFLAPVDDRCLTNRRTHRPVDHACFVIVGDGFLIEFTLVPMKANVPHQLLEQLFVDFSSNNVFVRPSFRIGLGECPLDGGDKGSQGIGERMWISHCPRTIASRGSITPANSFNRSTMLLVT